MGEIRRPAALVTGAAAGLGLAIARRLAGRGDHVVMTDHVAPALEHAAGELAAAGHSVEHVVLDVRDEGAVVAAVAAIDTATPLSTVVNNAGVAFSAPLLETSAEAWERLMDVNVRGTFLVLRESARAMLPRREGSIVNICSTSSFSSSSTPMIAYDTSKGAVALLTKAAARELARTGIRVNGVAPGTMDTALMRGLGADELSLEEFAASRIPLGRLGGTDEVAAAVEWLSSGGASYVLGHILVVDGGWLA